MAVLVLNCGSSSIKYTLFGDGDRVLRHGLRERVKDYSTDLEEVFRDISSALPEGLASIRGVGHRVVHGGARFMKSCLVGAEVMEVLRLSSHLAPLHNPHNIRGIEFAAARLPGVPQVAAFDTAFHAYIPERAHTYALPRDLCERFHLRRFGFHGISYQYVHRRLYDILQRKTPLGIRAILCHLGAGCSVAAVKDGICVDTSMGFTPLEGLVMGTRSGDLDPAVVLHLLEEEGPQLTRTSAFNLLNSESGLLGISGLSSDVRDLHKAAQEGNHRAKLALEVFSYRLKKYIAAYHGILGGANALVFCAGIGENAAYLRAAALEGMEDLGFLLDGKRNKEMVGGREGEIGSPAGRVRIFVIPTDEDRMICREVRRIVGRF